ncbi:cytochrome P450 [Botrimarina hoheduenensis]|uniref:Cytochrome P450 n=1 Tax=Botrimarina hoheduenensis TaxID=2528000 RepID=A0A5C5VRX9_9BACT|nr:cytochrome P450 [Botrimarina hoheduenensis]TWT40685.1 hypothetical protein Pla111_33300 [Botrimarina hoheduenensis]
MTDPADPFSEQRRHDGVKLVRAEGQDVPLLLRLRDIKDVCNDTQSFSNDNPLMIILHSEAAVRDVRQLPIESDPPDHTEYRALVEPRFRRPKAPEYQAGIGAIIDSLLDDCLGSAEVEVVRGFALPLQSRGLAQLLGVDESEADLWISWGIHVFRDNELGPKGSELDRYLLAKIEEARESKGDDFFSELNRAEFRGRKLTVEEKHGFANMAFAGGRDTVIHTVSGVIAYVAQHPEALEFLREDANRINTAAEEFVRYVSPLTVITRTCPHATEVLGHEVAAGGRIGLCWPSANRDETVFRSPDQVILDRKPNPHIGFGFGPHNCLGQHQARAILRGLLRAVCDRVERVDLIAAEPEIEQESSYSRQVGYKSLRVRFCGR